MKTENFLLVILVTFIIGIIRLGAQNTSVVELRIGNSKYELDTLNYILKNKTNIIPEQEINVGDCRVSFGNYEDAGKAWKEHFKPLFSKERIEELKVRISLFCICDSTGLIKEVEIFFMNRECFEKFTLSEIKAIEDAAKKYRYKFDSWYTCDGYVRIVQPLNPYLLYFEKLK